MLILKSHFSLQHSSGFLGADSASNMVGEVAAALTLVESRAVHPKAHRLELPLFEALRLPLAKISPAWSLELQLSRDPVKTTRSEKQTCKFWVLCSRCPFPHAQQVATRQDIQLRKLPAQHSLLPFTLSLRKFLRWLKNQDYFSNVHGIPHKTSPASYFITWQS